MTDATEALEHVVTKSNKLVEASYRLSVSEQRVIALLASKVAPADEDFKPYRFSIDELGQLAGLSGKHLHGRMRELTAELRSRRLEIKQPGGRLQIGWLSSAEYFDGAGEVELCFDPKLKPYLLQLKECFTSYRLKNVVRLRSTYSVRLYELLVQYAAKGERSFTLSELRDLLAIEKGSYSTWKDFKRNALEPAKKELAEHTDLVFKYEPKKAAHGRVVGVSFKFKLKTNSERALKRVRGRSRRTPSLAAEAQICYAREHGHCASTWERCKGDQQSACYWCTKHEALRLETEGQTRLPGF